jgi:hypothetical protein
MIGSIPKKKTWAVTNRYKKTTKEIGGLKGSYGDGIRPKPRQQAVENNAS